MLVRVSEETLRSEEAVSAISAPTAGAITLFLGVVRNNNLGRGVGYLVYDAYPTMA